MVINRLRWNLARPLLKANTAPNANYLQKGAYYSRGRTNQEGALTEGVR